MPKAPTPKAPNAAPGNPLTAEAGAGSNPYGLGVGNGGGDVVGGGGGGGGGGFGFYGSQVTSQLTQALRRDEKTRSGRYRVTLKVWIASTGQVTRSQVVNASGETPVEEVTRVVAGATLAQPPANLPQPITLRIVGQPS